MNKEIMTKNLEDFKMVMDKYNTPFVIVFGLVLGIARIGDYINHDTDVDVACFYHTKEKYRKNMKQVRNELKILGFTVTDNESSDSNYESFVRNGELIELWWFQKIDNEYIYNDWIRYPTHYFDTVSNIKFRGTIYPFPSSTLDYVELSYGIDWRIPVLKDGKGRGYTLSLNPKEVAIRQKEEAIIRAKRNLKPKISLILPCYQRAELLNLGLWALSQQKFRFNLEILVINDGLQDDTEQICAKYPNLNIRYLFIGQRNTSDKMLWRIPGFAYNIGIKLALGDVIMLSNPEMFGYYGTINELVTPVLKNAGCIGIPEEVIMDNNGKVLEYLNTTKTLSIPKELLVSEPTMKHIKYRRELPYLIAINKQVLIDIGGYDEDFIGYAGDDDDLVGRLKLKGLKYVSTPVKVIHLYHGEKNINTELDKDNPTWTHNQKLLNERKDIIVRNIGRDWGKL